MKVTLLKGSCNDGKTCPGVYRTDRGTLLVRGYVVTDPDALDQLGLPQGESVVEIPADLLDGEL